MYRKRICCVLALVALLIVALPAAAIADSSLAAPTPASSRARLLQQGDSPDTLVEQARALVAEQFPEATQVAGSLSPTGGDYPLFMGVDDTTVPAYTMDPTSNASTPHALGVQVWGSAYDPANNVVYINSGTTLYEWPVGSAVVNTLGAITDPAGAPQAMVGLAFYNGPLYAARNIANEAIYVIDTSTRVATVFIDYVDADFDFGGLAADPNSGDLYGTNDDATPYGAGLFRINPDGTATLIAPYPAGQTDIDGLAVSDDGYAYLVIDEPGFIYVWDFAGGAYATPLTNPWTSAETFSGGAYIVQPPTAVALTGLSAGVEQMPAPLAGLPLAALPAAAAAALGAAFVWRRKRD